MKWCPLNDEIPTYGAKAKQHGLAGGLHQLSATISTTWPWNGRRMDHQTHNHIPGAGGNGSGASITRGKAAALLSSSHVVLPHLPSSCQGEFIVNIPPTGPGLRAFQGFEL